MTTEELKTLVKIQEQITEQQDEIIKMLRDRIIYLEGIIKEERERRLQFLDEMQVILSK